jgi:Na+/H+-translocating membrane pyrophosphatase
MKDVNILEPLAISCLLIGAMMPYAFSALTMKSVGSAASKMVFNY